MLFVLDGTLLPINPQDFLDAYMPGLVMATAPLADPRAARDWITQSVMAMLRAPHGEKTCEQVFWQEFCRLSGGTRAEYEPLFEAYYRGPYREIRNLVTADPRVARLVSAVRARGLGCALATLPAFPALATYQRIEWAGLNPGDFDIITTYENSHAAKPHAAYYREILDRMGWDAGRCLMVGTDAGDDMAPALKLGMKARHLNEYPENRHGVPLQCTWEGGYDALLAFLETA